MTDNKRIRVNYRSGHWMEFDCDEFTLIRNQISGAYSAQWDNASPSPLKLGLEDVESIWGVPQ
jgi:hypothetical protein